jgi:exodeoxyribonuclease VII large subunit
VPHRSHASLYHAVVSRLPFDPEHAEGARDEARSGTGGGAPELTVTQATQLIKRTLETHVTSPIRVVGEVSNLSRRNHWYFSLKDEGAVLSCVAWASDARRFGFTPDVGDQVVASGRISHYPPQGRTQLYVSKLEPAGAGPLELRFRALCEELRRLGYFDEARKRSLPLLPRRVAVITSASGAALHDVVTTAAQRCRAVGLVLVDARVQGEGAAEDVARAIRWVDRRRSDLGVEAILVTRGGGSMEDLWAFNERVVADAVFGCELPVVAAVGHESDTTVIELVADVRASTPTQAAMRLVPDAHELGRQVEHLTDRLAFVVRRRIEGEAQRLAGLRRHEVLRDPGVFLVRRRRDLEGIAARLPSSVRLRLAAARHELSERARRLSTAAPAVALGRRHARLAVIGERLERARRAAPALRPRLDELAGRLERLARARLAGERERLDMRGRRLAALDPRHVLTRGYSYARRRDGRIVRSVTDVRAGDAMVTHVVDGSIDSVVSGRPRRGRRRAGDEGTEQMDLFGDAQ